MKIVNLTEHSKIYTSNAYLLTGEWNTLSDINTLIDVGRDHSIVESIKKASTGVGKHKVDQVILTHSHYDHAGMLKEIKKEFNAKVYAYSRSIDLVDQLLKDGDIIKAGDSSMEVIHTPGHSDDSICLYDSKGKVLFAGDSPLMINTPESGYEEGFIIALEKLVTKQIRSIYFGHGKPYIGDCNEILHISLQNARIGANK